MAQIIVDGITYDMVYVQNPGAGGDSSSDGSVSPGSAASKSSLSGGVFNSTAPTLTNGQQLATQFDQRGNLKTTLATLLSFENAPRGWAEFVNAANTNLPVPGGQVDYLLGVTGSAGDFLHHIDPLVMDSAKSAIVVRDGQIAPVLSLTTNGSTASTTTQINTAANPTAVTANQFRGSLLKIGGEYRRVLSHPAFSAGDVNQYNLPPNDPLENVPGLGASFTVEDRRYVWELRPNGTATTGIPIDCQFASTQGGYRLSTRSGVSLRVVGDFT